MLAHQSTAMRMHRLNIDSTATGLPEVKGPFMFYDVGGGLVGLRGGGHAKNGFRGGGIAKK